ncbi:hypothetical protein D9C73_014882 [Collichthys lucidus]|uniref:Uncharacterized protein n=1 Tax=Collichthys lucidus TaxID=240159 RepID=A0A4U5UZU7_COLLU|nr:hypothetical protein D9C73_014882 [Collichthys lucidus]
MTSQQDSGFFEISIKSLLKSWSGTHQLLQTWKHHTAKGFFQLSHSNCQGHNSKYLARVTQHCATVGITQTNLCTTSSAEGDSASLLLFEFWPSFTSVCESLTESYSSYSVRGRSNRISGGSARLHIEPRAHSSTATSIRPMMLGFISASDPYSSTLLYV